MKGRCEEAVSSYLDTLGRTFEVLPTEEGCVVVTPFLRSDNESIEVELVPHPDGRVLLTDNADTVGYLFVNGLNVNRSRELKQILGQVASRFHVQIEQDEIFVLAEPKSLGLSMHLLLNAIQDVSYLIYKKVRRAPVSFYDEVEKFLIANEVRYDPRYSLQGKAYVHTFRFHLNHRGHTLVEPLTATSPHAALVWAERLALWWIDIREFHPEYKKLTVLDDTKNRESFWEGRPTNVLHEYSDTVIAWSKKERLLEAVGV